MAGKGPLAAVMAGHRVRAYGEHRDVGRGGVHLGREGDDKHRHQPDHKTAARPLFIHAHDLRLYGEVYEQRKPVMDCSLKATVPRMFEGRFLLECGSVVCRVQG